MKEIIVDLFAGGGGASEGIRMAIGRNPDLAVNHDPIAIAMHKANHPDTWHMVQDIWDVPPRWATRKQPVGFLWASPDCKHFSKAKGAAPKRDREIRSLAWVVEKWAREVRPRIIVMENVEEFKTWGPLDKTGSIIKSQAGTTFRAFTRRLCRLGYKLEKRELRACDYGAPTIRNRLFIIARCDGMPIVWPEPTHGPGLIPYRTAAEIIDWSIPCPSIFERKKPLVENTMRRIAEGIRRYVINATVTVGGMGKTALVSAFLAKHFTGVVGHEITKPTGTVTTKDHHGLVTSHLIKLRGTCKHGQAVTEPAPTITAGGLHTGEVRSFLMKYNGKSVGQPVTDPLATAPTKDRFGLVTVMIKGEPYVITDIGMRMLSPRELFRAQGFSDSYQIDIDINGKRITKTAQVRCCGNSVCPPVAEEIIKANYVESIPFRHAVNE